VAETFSSTTGSEPELSVVIPLFNERACLPFLFERLSQVRKGANLDMEIVFVDDGSRDGTWELIRKLAGGAAYVRGIRLSRNHGHQRALLAGLSEARGSAVISMDGDLQHPPEKIPEMVNSWRQGARIVTTERLDAGVETKFKVTTSRLYYQLFSLLADADLSPGTSDFRLVDRVALAALLDCRYSQPFIRGEIARLGFDRACVPFEVEARHAGLSKYSLRRMMAFARTGLVSHSAVPLWAGIWLGLVTGGFAVLELLYVIVQYLLGNTVPGWASVLGLLALLFAVLFLIVGILGVYLADIHELVKSKPAYIVAERVGGAGLVG
jgi:polyisoprenyl-phosphate glycosyltransferase